MWQILNDITKYEGYTISFIKNGGRILSCRITTTLSTIELRDSYAIFAERLADFKKSLGLSINLDKEV